MTLSICSIIAVYPCLSYILPTVKATRLSYNVHDRVIYSVIFTSIFRRMGSKLDAYCGLMTVAPFACLLIDLRSIFVAMCFKKLVT